MIDLQRARLFCGRMIRIHAHPGLFPTLPSVTSTGDTQELLLTGGVEAGGHGAELYYRKFAWPSRNNTILSKVDHHGKRLKRGDSNMKVK
jgi:hypothetical protein